MRKLSEWKWPKSSNALFLGVIGIWVIYPLVVWFAVWAFELNPDKAGPWGDQFGALNTLFTGFAFVGAYLAITQQRQHHDDQMRVLIDERHDAEARARITSLPIWRMEFSWDGRGPQGVVKLTNEGAPAYDMKFDLYNTSIAEIKVVTTAFKLEQPIFYEPGAPIPLFQVEPKATVQFWALRPTPAERYMTIGVSFVTGLGDLEEQKFVIPSTIKPGSVIIAPTISFGEQAKMIRKMVKDESRSGH